MLKKASQQKQLLTLSTQVSDLSEVNKTLKSYLEEIINKIIPEQSKELIQKESQRLLIIKELLHIGFITFLIGNDVDIDIIFSNLIKSSSVKQFCDSLLEELNDEQKGEFESAIKMLGVQLDEEYNEAKNIINKYQKKD